MNAYLHEFLAEAAHQGRDRPDVECGCDDHRGRARARKFLGLRAEYAWAVPTREAIKAIDLFSPDGVVEIGAGGGYWASMLGGEGVNVWAYDIDPYSGTNQWFVKSWWPVARGGPEAAAGFEDQTLLLVKPLPEYGSEAIDKYRGGTVIVVGSDGDTPDTLDPEGWSLDFTWHLPSYSDVLDKLEVYVRD